MQDRFHKQRLGRTPILRKDGSLTLHYNIRRLPLADFTPGLVSDWVSFHLPRAPSPLRRYTPIKPNFTQHQAQLDRIYRVRHTSTRVMGGSVPWDKTRSRQ